MRRDFLFGLAAAAIVPVPASARRRFRFVSKNDSPETRRLKWTIAATGVGVIAIAGLVRAVFWAINRLEQNPPPPALHAPAFEVPVARAVETPVANPRKVAATSTFGKRV